MYPSHPKTLTHVKCWQQTFTVVLHLALYTGEEMFASCSPTTSVPAEYNKTFVTIFRYLEKSRIFFLYSKKKREQPIIVTTELLNDYICRSETIPF